MKDFWIKKFLPPVDNDQQRNIFCILYLPHLGFKFRNNLTKLFNKYYPNIKLQFVFKSPRRLSTLFAFKDCFPTLLCSSIIYKYSCSGCSTTYYGKTSRNLKIRCNEHLCIGKNGSKLASPSQSSILDHLKHTGHTVSLEDFSVTSKTENSLDLPIHECLFIQREHS